MAQDHGLCRKKGKSIMDRCTGRHCRPVLQLPTGQFVARKLLALTDKQTAGPANGDDPGAHGNERGQAKHNGRGKANLNGGK